MLDVGFRIPSTHEGLSALDVLRRQTVLSSETHLVLQFQRPHERWSLGRWVADVGSQTPVQLHTQTSQLQKRFGKHWGFDPGSQLSLKRVAVCVRESPSVDMWVRFLKLQKNKRVFIHMKLSTKDFCCCHGTSEQLRTACLPSLMGY